MVRRWGMEGEKMTNLIKIGTTRSRTVMMMVLEAGGEMRSTKASRRTLIFAASAIRQPVSFPEEYWPTEATLYLPADAKLQVWHMEAIWAEVRKEIRFKDADDNDFDAFDFSTECCGPFTLIPPAPPERDVFKEPRVGDEVQECVDGVPRGEKFVVDEVTDKGVFIRRPYWRLLLTPEDNRFNADNYTVVHRAEEVAEDE